ncbi:hypothetical protein LINPERHAP2_LOCUS11653 [Linum perenne]
MAMKTQLTYLWNSGRDISTEDRGNGLYLFQFYYKIDMKLVMEGGSWTSNGFLLTVHELQPGEDLTTVALHEVDFWVQVHDLTPDFYSELVGRSLGNILGTFVAYGEYNRHSLDRPYMQLCVRMDVRKALKKEKPVKKPSKEIMVTFKYERLPTFCYLCGPIGHVDRFCELVLLWS